MRNRIISVVVAASAIVLATVALVRGLPAVGPEELLVLSDRVVDGPARPVIAPWAARRVVPRAPLTVARLTADLDGTVSWPLELRARLRIDPTRIGGETRQELLRAGGLRETLEALGRAALAGLDPSVRSSSLVRPAALAGPVGTALEGTLPDGVELSGVEVVALAAPGEARDAGLAWARSSRTAPVARVLYVGLDGADWEIADRMIARGELPTLRGLVERGVRADLQSYEPMMSPLLWTTALTGRPPDEHGIFDFTMATGDGRQVPISSRFRHSAAIWQILTAMDQASAFVNFWATHPPDEIRGILVSDIADRSLRDPSRRGPLPAAAVYPSGALDSLQAGLWSIDDTPVDTIRRYAPALTDAEIAEARAFHADKQVRKRWKDDHEEGRKTPPAAFLAELATNSHNLEQIAAWLLEQPDLGVVAVYFGDIDQAGHNFQHLAPPPHPLAPDDERRLYGEVVERTYRLQDATLGRLIDAAGPETIVIVHSDHGFTWGARRPLEILPFTRGQPVEWHRLQGLFVAAGGPVRRGVRIPSVTLYDIAPTILALRGVPAAENMRGRVITELVNEAVSATLPGERVPSWDPLVAPRRALSTEEDRQLAELQEQMVEQLRALGYVGGAADESEPAPRDARAAGNDAAGDERPQVMYYRNQATWYMNEDRFADAERALVQANELRPLSKTYSLLSEARAAQGNIPGAIEALEDGLRRFPDQMPGAAVLWLVELHLQRDDVGAAERVLARRSRNDQDALAPLAVARGRIAEARGDLPGAKRAYIEALEQDPRELRAAQRFAALATSAEERAGLGPYLLQALERDPRIEEYWQMLGLLLLERGQPAEAAQAFHSAVELHPENVGYQLNEATARLRAGQPGQARQIYETLAGQGVEHPAVWVNLGSLRARAGQWKGALRAWQRAQELGVDDPRVASGIEEARRRLGG